MSAVAAPACTMIDARDFGITGDGDTDDTDAIQAALDAAGKDAVAHFPGGRYNVSRQLRLEARFAQGVHHWRADQGGTLFVAIPGFQGDSVFDATSNAFGLSDVGIICDGNVKHGVHTFSAHGPSVTLHNVSVSGATDAGFWLEHSQVMRAQRLHAVLCGGPGYRVTDANASVLDACSAERNAGCGIEVLPGKNSGSFSLVGFLAQSNGNTGISVSGVVQARIERPWVEGNCGDGIHLSGLRNSTISGARLIPGPGSPDDRCVRLTSCRMTTVEHCHAGKGTHLEWIRIRDEGGSGNDCTRSNWRLSNIVTNPLDVEAA